MQNLDITVAICTRNRSALLDTTLASLSQMTIPPHATMAVVVVNNDSTDNTEAVISKYTERLRIRSVLETRLGAAFARNRAVESASGDYMLWTDDDAVVAPNWLSAYVDAFGRYPEGVVFGGPIRLKFEGTPPAWMQRVSHVIRAAYAELDHGNEEFELDPSPYFAPWGPNYAVRLPEHRQFRYDTRLGPGPNGTRLGDETDLLHRMLVAGHRGYWIPAPVVEHFVPKRYQTISHLRKYFESRGRTQALLDGDCPEIPKILGVPRWIWRGAVTGEIKYYLKRCSGSPESWGDQLAEASTMKGYLKAGLASVLPAMRLRK
jgi:glycosyltransferase involved in cell wall biosynthesis